MNRTRERIPPPADAAPAKRPPALITFGLPSLLALPLAGAVWMIQRLGAGPWVAAILTVALGAALGLAARRRLSRSAGVPWWAHWDVVGFVATAGLAGLVTVLAVETMLPAPGLFRTTRVVLPVALAAAAFAASVGAAIARSSGAGPRQAARSAAGVWSDPPADWAFFVLGVLLSLPLAALISPVLTDPDSPRFLVAASQARHEGLGFLTETQQVFLPVLIYTPVVAVAGTFGATAVSVAAMQALVGVVGFLTRKVTGGVLAPIAAMLALLALEPFTSLVGNLAMYTLMLALGYLAGWVGLRAIRAEARGARLGLAVLAALLVAAAVESHDIGKIFAFVPLFLLALEPSRRGVVGVALIYAALALFAIPRIAVNLAEGGFAHFTVNRTDWIVQSGYTRMINREFWQLPVHSKPAFFAQLVRPYWAGATGWVLAVPVGLSLVALATARWRARIFGLLVAGLMFYGLLQTGAPPYARYLSPVIPGLAIAAGAGVRALEARTRNRIVSGALVMLLGAGAAVAYVSVVAETHARNQAVPAESLRKLTRHIDDGRGVTGVRMARVMSVEPSLRVVPARSFTEAEWVTYLTWPSDEAVLEVFRGRDIGWVILQDDYELEVRYHDTWVFPEYGLHVRHPTMIERSPSFCRVDHTTTRIGGYTLYRVGPCP